MLFEKKKKERGASYLEEGQYNIIASVFHSEFPSPSVKMYFSGNLIINWGKGMHRIFWGTLDIRSAHILVLSGIFSCKHFLTREVWSVNNYLLLLPVRVQDP